MSKNGGPAFPFAGSDGHCLNDSGMSLRDYFAAKAMQAAICAAANWGPLEFRDFDCVAVAKFAIQQADAMLKEREK